MWRCDFVMRWDEMRIGVAKPTLSIQKKNYPSSFLLSRLSLTILVYLWLSYKRCNDASLLYGDGMRWVELRRRTMCLTLVNNTLNWDHLCLTETKCNMTRRDEMRRRETWRKKVVIFSREKKKDLWHCDAKTREILDDDPTCKLGQREGGWVGWRWGWGWDGWGGDEMRREELSWDNPNRPTDLINAW